MPVALLSSMHTNIHTHTNTHTHMCKPHKHTIHTHTYTCTQSSPHRTTLIILCEDGSLRIYVANNNANTEYWLQPQFQPASPLAILRSKVKKPSQGTRKIENPKFPVDFFEHCQQMQYTDIEVSCVMSHVLRALCMCSQVHVPARGNTVSLYGGQLCAVLSFVMVTQIRGKFYYSHTLP